MKKKYNLLFEKSSASVFALAFLFVLMLSTTFVQGAARTASVSGNWSNTATWGGSAVPTSADAVTINSGITVTVNISGAQCSSITFAAVAATSNLNFNTSSSLTVSGLISMPRPSSGFTCNINVNDGVLSCGTLTMASTTSSRNDVINITTGTVTISGTITTGTTGCQFVFTDAGTLNVGSSFSSTPTLTTYAGSTVNYNGAAQNVLAATYYNLTLSGSGTKTSSGAQTINGNLSIANGATYSHGAYAITVVGTTTVGGGTSGGLTITSGTGTKRFTGLTTINSGATWDNSINSAVNFRGGLTNNGTFTCGTGSITFTTNTQALTGTLSIPNAAVTTIPLTNNGTLTVGTSLTGSGSLINGAGATLNLNFTALPGITTLTASAAGNLVNYGFAGTQTVKGTTYNNLTLSGGGTKTLGGATIVGGTLALGTSILTTTAANLLTISNTSPTAIMGSSATSFIDGPLCWTLPSSLAAGTTYNFPIGKGTTYLPFSLNDPTTGTGIVTAQAEAFNASTAGSFNATLTSVSTSEYWSLATVGNFTNSSVSINRPTAIAPFDAIGSCATLGGVYAYLGGTAGVNSVTTSNLIGSNKYFVFGQAGCIVAPADPGNPTSDSPQCTAPGVTLAWNGTAPAGETWYWQTSPTGTSTANSGSTFNVTTSGTYYIRSQFNTTLCWSTGAGSVTVVVNGVPAISSPTSGAITLSTADLGGNITDIGCPDVTARGIYWSTTSGFTPPLEGTVVMESAGPYLTGAFTEAVSGLTPTTTYFYKAFATNSFGTVYTTQGTFTTGTTALFGTTPSSFGAAVCTNTTAGPNSFTITGTFLTADAVTVEAPAGFSLSETSGGSYTGTLSIPQAGGAFSQVIYVKFSPTAVQSYNGNIIVSGGGATSINVAVVGSGVDYTPTVTSPSSASVTASSAVLGGNITNTGCTNVIERGIYYSLTNGFADGTGTLVSETPGPFTTGVFTEAISGLTLGTTYYYKAFATNSAGTVYTSQGTFTTGSIYFSATALTSFGTTVCINTTTSANSFTITGTNLTVEDVVVTAPTGFLVSDALAGTYASVLTLTQVGGPYSQVVYVKFAPTLVQSYNASIVVSGGGATAINVAAVGSGVYTLPTITSPTSAAIAASTVTLGGNITSIGCSDVVERGIYYSTTTGFANGAGTKVSETTGPYAAGVFTEAVTGLTPATTYYYKAFATNGAGSVYTTQGTFTTGSITLSATTLTSFGASVCINTTTNANSFTITGTNLLANDVIVTAPAGFALSETSTGTYSSPLTLTQAGGPYSKIIYVKFSPTVVQSYNGTITVSGGGAPSINVAAVGSGVDFTPTLTAANTTLITMNSATLNDTITNIGCSGVLEKGFYYSTINGFDPLTQGTKVSQTFGPYPAGAISEPISGLTPATTYYYKGFAANYGGTTYSAQAQFSTATVALFATALTSFGNAVCVNTVVGPYNFTITGTYLTSDDVVVGPLYGFSYSTTSGGTYTPMLTLTQGGGGFSQIVYVKFSPDLVQTYSGNIVISGGGAAASINVAAIGIGVNTPPTMAAAPTSAAVTGTTATLGGNISVAGCSSIIERGIFYSTTSGFANGTGTKVSVTPGPYTTGVFTVPVTGLTPQTTYYFRSFASNVGGYSAYSANEGTFTTGCANAIFPYFQDFESITPPSIPSCHTIQNAGSGNNWVTSLAAYGSTSKALEYAYNLSTAGNAWFYTPGMSLTAGTSYTISFKYVSGSASYNERLKVSYGTAATSASMTTNIYTNATVTNITPNIQTSTFTPATTGTFYIGFNCYSIANQGWLFVDDISIYPTPSCVTPATLTTPAVAATTATLTWTASISTPPNGYEWEVRSSGAAGSGATGLVTSGTTAAGVLTANATGLPPTTSLTAYVRAHCIGTDYSYWSNGTAFTTACLPSILPWTENFDAMPSIGTSVIPSCWKGTTAGTGTPWATMNAASLTYNDPSSSPNYLTCYYYPSAVDNYIITPGFDLTAGTNYDFSFKYAGDGYSGWTADARYNTSQTGTGSTIMGAAFLASGTTSSATYASVLRSFTPATSGTYYFMVHVNSSAVPYYLGLDDFKVEASQTCFPPSAVVASAITTSSATMSWAAGSPAPSNGYDWELRTSGAAGSGATGLVTNGTTAAGVLTTNLSGLTPASIYYFYVRGYCGGSSYSYWTSVYTLATACNAITTFPWSENFDAMGSIGAGIAPTCWTFIVPSGSPLSSANAASNGYHDPYTAPNYLTCEGTVTGNKNIITPGFDMVAGYSYTLNFKYAGDQFSGWTVTTRYNTSPSATGSTLFGSPIISSGTATVPTWNTATETLYPATSGTYYFIVRCNNTSSSTAYNLGFDDFTVTRTLILPPAITSLGSLSGCAGTTITINGTDLGGASVVTVGGTAATVVSNTPTQVIATLGAGTTGTVSVTTPGGIAVSTDVFTVLPAPTAVASSNLPVCSGSALNLSGTTDIGTVFAWTGPNSFTSTSQNPSIPAVTSIVAGTYYFTAFLNGCSSPQASTTIVVNSPPSPISVSPSAPIVCFGGIQPLVVSGGSASGTLFTETYETYPTSKFAMTGTGLVTASSNTTYYSQGTKSVMLSNPSTTSARTDNNAYASQINVDLNGYTSATLTFSHICTLEGPYTTYDNGWIEYSTNGGSTWTTFPTSSYAGSGTLMTAAGTGVIFSTLSYTDWTAAMTSSTTTLGTGPATSLWKNETINIPAAALTSNQFRIRFLVTSDGSVADYGWLIDNVNINGVGSASGAWSPISELYTNAGATTPYTSGIATTIYTKPTSNHTYTYTATSSNGCTSSNTASVSVQVVAPPTGDTALYFCNSATAANLTAIGSTLKWYNAAVGGGAFSPSYVLINGQTYYASQTINGCESPTRFAVHVTISAVSVPTGSAAQTFNGSATPADIVATGTNLQWYLTPTGGTALAPTDQLVNATTYYGSQTINGCESSSRMAVAVTILYIKYVNIHFYLEGLYNSSTQMMNEAMDGNTGLPFYAPGIADRIQIDLFEEFSPYNPIGVSISGIDLATNGVASFQISPTHSGNYYIRVSNRNHLATWSAIAVPFNTAVVNYDFATSLFQAYGSSPQVQMSSSPDAFAFLLGDLDQGGWIDAVDFNMFEPDLTNGATGFYTTDFDGGGWVDAVDFNMFEPRLTLGNASEYPAKKK